MPGDAEDMVVFEQWMKRCRITYETEALKLKRFETFKVTLRVAEEANPLTKEPIWELLSKFSDLTDEEIQADYLTWRPESEDEDEKNGVRSWYLDERFATDSDEDMAFKCFDEEEEEGSTVGTLKRKCGLCSCDEKDTKDQVDASVKRQRPCSCSTAPPAAAAADEQQDITAPV